MQNNKFLNSISNKKNNLFKEQKKFVNKFAWNKRLFLIIPFILLTLAFLIVPIIIIFVFSFKNNGHGISENWAILTGTVWQKIGKSAYIAIVVTIFCLLIGFPFTYFLIISKNKIYKSIVWTLITAPIWVNVLVKLIGLKTIFDIIGNELNSTYGDIYTIIGLVYLYIPFVMTPLYSSLELLPRNLINASKDLGRGSIYTFFCIIIPWTKNALISCIVLVLLPTFTTVAVPSFLNNNNDSGMIGDIIISEGESGLNSPIALSRTSVLALVVSSFMLIIYVIIVFSPKVFHLIRKKIKNAKK